MRTRARPRPVSIAVALAVLSSTACGTSTVSPTSSVDGGSSGGPSGSDSGESSDAPAPVLADGAPAGSDAEPDAAQSATSTTLHFAGSAYTMYASIGGGAPHLVQLDTGSLGLYVPRSVLGATATVSTTVTCSITYVSSGNVLSGHQATAPVALLGSTAAGDVPSPPTTVPMPLCAVDDATFTGGVMGVGFGRGTAPDPTWNALLQMTGIHPGYVLGTHPTPWVQVGLTSAGSTGFQTIALAPSTSGDGDWSATSLRGCLALPSTPAFAQACGPLLVDTGIPECLLWGASDPTLGGVVATGQTTVPSGTAMQIASPADAGILDYAFVVGTGADTPSAVDLRTASAFSINTGRALLVDYDYLFDAQAGLVGFRRAN